MPEYKGRVRWLPPEPKRPGTLGSVSAGVSVSASFFTLALLGAVAYLIWR